MHPSGHKISQPQVTAFGRKTGRPSQPDIGLGENFENERRSPGHLCMTVHDIPGKAPPEQQQQSSAGDTTIPRDSSQISPKGPSRPEVHTYSPHSTYCECAGSGVGCHCGAHCTCG
ncbi:hypothetical protein IWQ61_005058 [Dispira simplex]|nr:hypothetical protein IWQ61_005058 [Dispira simplex]